MIKPFNKDRVLFHINGRFDWSLPMCYVLGACFSSTLFLAINWTFYLCHEAGLNIGIAQTIWGFTPFFSSGLDYFIFNSVLRDN